MTHSVLRLTGLTLVTTIAALCHYTWIATASGLEVGKPATITINHGHKFPQSEEAVNARQLDVFAVAPSGAKVKLEPVAATNSVTARFTPAEAGLHRIGFVQDRGVSSRTPKGVKSGGRDQNPDATQSYRTYRTSMAYISTRAEATSGKPAGLELELVGTFVSGAWEIQLLKRGKPASGVAVELFLRGTEKTVEIGKTAADGKVRYQPSSGSKGPALFSVAFKDAAPAGAHYDSVNYESSLYVTW